jgi:hypothetical protein
MFPVCAKPGIGTAWALNDTVGAAEAKLATISTSASASAPIQIVPRRIFLLLLLPDTN